MGKGSFKLLIGERATGNGQRESGNERTAVILIRIQNGGQNRDENTKTQVDPR